MLNRALVVLVLGLVGCTSSSRVVRGSSNSGQCLTGLTREAREAAENAATERHKQCELRNDRFALMPPSPFWACYDDEMLEAMNEGPLWGRTGESYRFLWLRSFQEPVMVRVDLTDAGNFITGKTLDGRGGFAPGCINRSVHRKLTEEETEGLLSRYRAVFTTPLPAWSKAGPLTIGLDGAQWVFEKVGQSVRVVRDLWSPPAPEFAAYRELCMYMVQLAGFEIPERERY